MLSNLNDFENETSFNTDVCIIGAGIAGLFIAHNFIDKGIKVLLIEAGNLVWDKKSQDFYQAKIIGCNYTGHMEGRFRVFGGSSIRWGGQLLQLDPNDLIERSYIENSGWPITFNTLLPYYKKAQSIMKVCDLPCNSTSELDSNFFKYQYSRWIRFQYRNLAETLGAECTKGKNIEVILNATATHIQLYENGQAVKNITITSNIGRKGFVHAKKFVVCSGALETPRLLLASNNICPNGIGNDHDVVGRYFQDHISFRAAELKPNNLKIFSNYFAPSFRKKIMYSPRLQLSIQEQNRLGCLGVFGHILFESSENSCFSAVREILRRKQTERKLTIKGSEVISVLKSIPYFASLSYSYFIGGKIPYPPKCKWYLQVDVEQEPNPASRVYLSDERDDYGMPLLSIKWQVGERERQTAEHYIQYFKQEWQNHLLGEAHWNNSINETKAWLSHSHDAYHQAGTTRMHQDPKKGVVDTNLKVHGIHNLYISSCSVFPTSGSANPTFSLMALSLRLVDHLLENK